MFEDEGELTYRGRWVSYEGILFEPKPALPLPLLVGGNHANALRRAAMLGDGWHPLFLEPADYARGRKAIEDLRREADLTRPFLFSMSGSEVRLLDAANALPGRREAAQGTSYAPAVGGDARGRQRFIGTPSEVRDDCRALGDAGVEQLVLRFAVPLDPLVGPQQHSEQLRRFAGEVLPYLA